MNWFLTLCIPCLIFPLIYGAGKPWRRIKRRAYDYIIVGGGAAGCVVATRLSENPNVTVLVLEAGPDDSKDRNVAVPRAFLGVVNSYDWGFVTEPQKYTGDSRIVSLSQGKLLGGSSSHNGMNIVRGSRYDFDRWAELGNEGWGYEDVLPYFKKSEDMIDPHLAKSKYHGTGGPMQIKQVYRDPIIGEIIKAGKSSLGLEEIDHNGPTQDGISLMQNNVNREGKRHHPPEAFLRPVLGRRNLEVVTDALVLKVEINKCKKGCLGKARGVTVAKDQKISFIRAKKEVIMSAGAINSPKLLLMSGIGPKKDLKKHRIPLIADLPVGLGLQDHYRIPFSFFLPEDTTFDILKVNTFEALFEYVFSGTGPWAAYGCQVSAFLKTTHQPPEDKFHYVEVPIVNNIGFFGRELVDIIRKGGKLSPAMIESVKLKEQFEKRKGISAAVVHNHPRSVGKVELRSIFPNHPPIVTRHFFEDPLDIADLIEGVRFYKKWLNDSSLTSRGVDPEIGKNGCPDKTIPYDTDEYWACYIKRHATSFSHFTSTCRMSPDETGVVTNRLKVKGVDKLRVIDASIMPNVVSGHVMAATIMIAEKGSDMIKEDM